MKYIGSTTGTNVVSSPCFLLIFFVLVSQLYSPLFSILLWLMLVIRNQFDLEFEQFLEAVHRRAREYMRKRRGDRLSVVDFSDSCFPLPLSFSC
jgi:hypothetical protein